MSKAGHRRMTKAVEILGDCYCRLQPSPIAGIGVFAIRTIPRGTDPFRLPARYAKPGYMRLTEPELVSLPPGLAALIHTLFLPDERGALHIPTCGTNLVYLNHYLNHSPCPNMRT